MINNFKHKLFMIGYSVYPRIRKFIKLSVYEQYTDNDVDIKIHIKEVNDVDIRRIHSHE